MLTDEDTVWVPENNHVPKSKVCLIRITATIAIFANIGSLLMPRAPAPARTLPPASKYVTKLLSVGPMASAARNSDGTLELFAARPDHALWHIWQETAQPGSWSVWSSLGGVVTSAPVVILNSDGRLEVFARGADGALWHTGQETANSRTWSDWASLGGHVTSGPAATLNADGRLEVFARGAD